MIFGRPACEAKAFLDLVLLWGSGASLVLVSIAALVSWWERRELDKLMREEARQYEAFIEWLNER